jgi:hypothetical protein
MGHKEEVWLSISQVECPRKEPCLLTLHLRLPESRTVMQQMSVVKATQSGTLV